VYQLLSDDFNITSYYYNPNIHPLSEYNKRLEELKKFSDKMDFPLITGEYDSGQWMHRVRPLRFYGERSERCRECYEMRLDSTFVKARELGMDVVTTVLSISPHKDAKMINSIGSRLQEKYGIEFYQADFKKRDGYKKSVQLSREHGFYRQDYCGCSYSMIERNRESLWSMKGKEFREKMIQSL